eukprot:TRINITY_DN3377_c0_g1_i1.p1 TRINITY_DN3377_c0_g1~~TRINITY_DN3377_c0_g1_i1.p1  ORF type:complete len:810 (-),score=185.93 TRINITY_DN3377_c0_g1_i1:198-2627(-)
MMHSSRIVLTRLRGPLLNATHKQLYRKFSTTPATITQRPFLNTSYENSCLKRDLESFKSSKDPQIATALIDRYVFLEEREKNPTERYKEALTLWNELTQSNTSVPTQTFTQLVGLLLLCEKKEFLLPLIDSIIQQNIIPEDDALSPIFEMCLKSPPHLEKFTSYIIEKKIELNELLSTQVLQKLISKNLNFENFSTHLEQSQQVNVQELFLSFIDIMDTTKLTKLYSYLQQSKGQENINPVLMGEILSQYFRLGQNQTALDFFKNSPKPVVEMWQSVLKNLNPVKEHTQIYDLFYENREREGYCLDEESARVVLKACEKFSFAHVQQVHKFILLQDLEIEKVVAPDLISAYTTFGPSPFLPEVIRGIFLRGPNNSFILATAMDTLVKENKHEQALLLFNTFAEVGNFFKEDNFLPFILGLYAAGDQGDLYTGELIRASLKSHPPIYRSKEYHHALCLMYAKAGEVLKAFRVFLHILQKTVEDWNVFLKVCAINSLEQFPDTYNKMLEECIFPNQYTMALLLKYTNEKLYFWDKMKEYRIKPTITHCKEVVGYFPTMQENLDFIKEFETKNPHINSQPMWKYYFKYLVRQGKTDEALQIMKTGKMSVEEKEDPEVYWKFALLLKSAGKFDQEQETLHPYLETYKEFRKLKKSWVYILDKKHTFHMFEESHEQSSSVVDDIVRYLPALKQSGYVEKEYEDIESHPSLHHLARHSEVLAFLFAHEAVSMQDFILITTNYRMQRESLEILVRFSNLWNREIRVSDPLHVHTILPGNGSTEWMHDDLFAELKRRMDNGEEDLPANDESFKRFLQ